MMVRAPTGRSQRRPSRRWRFPAITMAGAFGFACAYLAIRGLDQRATFGWRWTLAELTSNLPTYLLFVACTTSIVVVSWVLGRAQDRLWASSNSDLPTGLPNRRFFERRLTEELDRSSQAPGPNGRRNLARRVEEMVRGSRDRVPLALMIVDVDHLKEINDRLGHDAGDTALRLVAESIRRSCRAQDLAARWGGDEFVVLAPGSNALEALGLTDRIRATLALRVAAMPPWPIALTTSIGVADLDRAGARTAAGLFWAADRALYVAKSGGRDRVVLAPQPTKGQRALPAPAGALPRPPKSVLFEAVAGERAVREENGVDDHLRALEAGNVAAPATRPPPVTEPGALATSTRADVVGELLPGTRYRLLDRIGEGSTGEVWAAEHTDLGKKVALKILSREHSQDADFVARFRAEARTVARIGHPNIVAVSDFGEIPDGRIFFAMELLVGESLYDRLARERVLPHKEAARIAEQVLDGLSAAHAEGIVHRDVKPENVFLVRDGPVKLLDFGIAKTSVPGPANGSRRTIEGAVFGTPAFMAPEQAAGQPVDHKADLYAVGVMLYEMVTGTLPFTAPTNVEILAKQILEPPQPPSRRSSVPAPIERVILRAMAKRPAERFASAGQMAPALRAAVRAAARPRRRVAVFAALGALMVLGGGFAWVRSAPGQGHERRLLPRTVRIELPDSTGAIASPLRTERSTGKRVLPAARTRAMPGRAGLLIRVARDTPNIAPKKIVEVDAAASPSRASVPPAFSP